MKCQNNKVIWNYSLIVSLFILVFITAVNVSCCMILYRIKTNENKKESRIEGKEEDSDS